MRIHSPGKIAFPPVFSQLGACPRPSLFVDVEMPTLFFPKSLGVHTLRAPTLWSVEGWHKQTQHPKITTKWLGPATSNVCFPAEFSTLPNFHLWNRIVDLCLVAFFINSNWISKWQPFNPNWLVWFHQCESLGWHKKQGVHLYKFIFPKSCRIKSMNRRP